MKFAEKVRRLADVTAHQWGLVTSAQAREVGVTRLDLSRMTNDGHLIRLAHGVYFDAGVPEGEFDELRAYWLSTEPERFAEERIGDRENGVVVAGESAAALHGIGDFQATVNDFIVPVRRQTQRTALRYRQREIDERDVTLVEGLPAMTVERTIADLIDDHKDLSLVADALRDAYEVGRIDHVRLADLLAPLAGRRGFEVGDGEGLLNFLMGSAGIDRASIAERIASTRGLGELVTAKTLSRFTDEAYREILASPALKETFANIRKHFSDQLKEAIAPINESLRIDISLSTAELVSGAIEKNLGDALAQFVRGPTSGATVLKFSSNAGADALKELSRYRAYSTASHAERRQEPDGTQP